MTVLPVPPLGAELLLGDLPPVRGLRRNGQRLLDGRQATILALAHDGQHDHAAELVEQCTITESWEQAVQSLLRVLCRRPATAQPEHEITAMLTTVLTTVLTLMKQPDPTAPGFRTRVAITALDLAETHSDPRLPVLRAELIATAHSDAYAARDVVTHPRLHTPMTTDQHRDLTRLVHTCGLGSGTIPEPLHGELMAAVSSAEQLLRTILARSSRLSSLSFPATP